MREQTVLGADRQARLKKLNETTQGYKKPPESVGGATRRYRNTNASNHRDPGAAKPQPHDCMSER